jgi:hypothetical protein
MKMQKSINAAQKDQTEKKTIREIVAIVIHQGNHLPIFVVDGVVAHDHNHNHLLDHDLYLDHLRDLGQKLVKREIRGEGIYRGVLAYRLIESWIPLGRVMMRSWMETFSCIPLSDVSSLLFLQAERLARSDV